MAIDTTELRSHLQRLLPAYMIPAAFIGLDALPLTATGKVDRQALPAGAATERPLDTPYVAPATPTEVQVAQIWAEVLGLDRVGADDQFFELGGHSLLATQVVARLQRALGFEVPLRWFFDEPTVRSVAAGLDAARVAGVAAAPGAIVRAPRSGPLPLSFAQERLWFLDQLVPGDAFYNVPAALRIRGHVDVPDPGTGPVRSSTPARGAPDDLSLRWRCAVPARRRPGGSGGRPRRGSAGSPARGGCGGAPPNRARRRTPPVRSRTRAALARSRVRVSPTDHTIVATAHHIIADGWSIGVLLRELAELAVACHQGTPARLRDLPVQYADYAAWQRERLQGDVLEREVGFWRDRLSGAQPLAPPTDRPRPPIPSFRGSTCSVHIDAALTAQLRALSRSEGTTLFMTLLAAFTVLLSRYSGQEDVCVGTPIAGRTRAEIEPVIGFFVNTVVIRTIVSGDPTFSTVLRRVRDAAVEAYAHQELPFEKLVAELKPVRDLSRHPLVQVMFALQTARATALEGMALSAAGPRNRVARDSSEAARSSTSRSPWRNGRPGSTATWSPRRICSTVRASRGSSNISERCSRQSWRRLAGRSRVSTC